MYRMMNCLLKHSDRQEYIFREILAWRFNGKLNNRLLAVHSALIFHYSAKLGSQWGLSVIYCLFFSLSNVCTMSLLPVQLEVSPDWLREVLALASMAAGGIIALALLRDAMSLRRSPITSVRCPKTMLCARSVH